MKRVDNGTETVDELYTDGNPGTGTPATVVDASCLNNIQEEICTVIEDEGISLDEGNYAQLKAAIKSMVENGEAISKFTLANNQSLAADVTGLLFDKTKHQAVLIEGSLYRKTSTPTELCSFVKMLATYKPVADTWTLHDPESQGDETLVTFSITSAGQIQYTSSNLSGGSYVGYFRPKVRRFKL